MSKNSGKLTATDVLELINRADASVPQHSALGTWKVLRNAVDLGEPAFLDRATFSAAQRIISAMPSVECPLPITPQQMRDARILLRWSRERLAALSDTTASFILAYENKGHRASMFSRERSFDGLTALRATLAENGIEFIETNGDPGVSLRQQ
jgi:hypothetical protein